MRLTRFLTHTQVQRIHCTALRVPDEVGVKVEHDEVGHRLWPRAGG
jgi:trimethylamine:corrinoid methyltransferase-like protein